MNANTLKQFKDGDFAKSSYCTYPPGGCAEIAMKGDVVAMRDAKNPAQVLLFTHAEWQAFVQGVKAGEFDVR